MTQRIINRELLPDNDCFGCGHANDHGLKLELFLDDNTPDTLLGRLDPKHHQTGFPGIVHGGVLYTAMDCLAAWTANALRPKLRVAWILRSAATKYHRPSPPGQLIMLSGRIAEETEYGGPILVHTEARTPDGELIVEGDFKEIPLAPERFRQVAGLHVIPENWEAFFDNLATLGA
jgi:acyl-coenzyme A thioesterase PaaI-like protein